LDHTGGEAYLGAKVIIIAQKELLYSKIPRQPSKQISNKARVLEQFKQEKVLAKRKHLNDSCTIQSVRVSGGFQ
jgi:hypothetical protein